MIRTLLRVLFTALGILVAERVVRGLSADRFVDLLAVAVILGILNASLGTFLKVVTLVPRACSFGCLTLVINGLIFWLAGSLAGLLGLGFHVSGFWAAFFGALVASLVAALLEWFLLGRDARDQGPRHPRRLKILN